MSNKLTNIRAALWMLGLMALLFQVSFSVAQDSPTPAPAQKAYQIEIRNFHFSPDELKVPAGAKVTWINRDEEPHTVASVDGLFKKSPPLDTDQEFSFTFTTPGTYAYFCTVHPRMTGRIIVEKAN